jgi:cytochrome c biogenesis protein CcmG, thiol:disulfide interchange protein DsbE
VSEPSETVPSAASGRATPRRVAPFAALAAAIVLAGLFVVLAGSSTGGDNQVQSFLIGRPAPSVVRATLAGDTFDLSRRKGSWVVLNFFDPTCVPCVDEHPELIAFDEQQAQLVDGAELYTIINRGTPAAVQTFFDDNGGDWPVIVDPDGGVSVDFGVAQVPETWIVDPNGIVQVRYAGPITAEQLARDLQVLREGRI